MPVVRIFHAVMNCYAETDRLTSRYFAQLATIKLFDYWGMDGFAKRIGYLQSFYKSCKDETENALKKHLSGKASDTLSKNLY